MGRTTRWLKAVLGLKNDKGKDRNAFDSASTVSSERKEKKRWSFGKSTRGSCKVPPIPTIAGGIPIGDSFWHSSYLTDIESNQNKHAIAVAAATAAAADAAVAAAQAAVEVVKLTTARRTALFISGKGAEHELASAIKIQTFFRGYLARKARRALKALVKLQALVRGYLVRKRAAATLHSMQALIRAQCNVRATRAVLSINKENRYQCEVRPRKSIERHGDPRCDLHRKRFSVSYDLGAINENPKIVEIDTYKPVSRSARAPAAVLSECGEDFQSLAMSSPLPCPPLSSRVISDARSHQDFDWYITGEECRFSTAHNTPRFASSMKSNCPTTPAKSLATDSNFPNYMSSTQSSSAKLRSHSAPKQRPEPLPRRERSHDKIMASRNSISSIRMHKPCYQIDENMPLRGGIPS